MSSAIRALVSVGTLTVLVPLAGVAVASAQTPADAKKPPKHAKSGDGIHYLYLVRHGYYEHHHGQDEDERVTQGLDSLGQEQARMVGERLASLPIKFDRLVSSQFLRAKQTADEMGQILHMTPVRDSLLNECAPTSDDAERMAEDTPREIADCDSARVREWRRYFTPTPDRDTYDLLVCHAHVIRWTLMKAIGADTKHWPDQDAANAALTIIAVRPDSTVRLVTYNDTGHIPWAKQTWSGHGGGWLQDK
jgi:serine/threonine-protein phosphatase PGAM5